MLVSESRRRPGAARPSPLFPHEAQQLLAGGSLQQAMEVCRQGLVYFPDQIAGYMILSQIFLAMGKHDRAANVLRDGFRRTGAPQLEHLHQQLLHPSEEPRQTEATTAKRNASPFTRIADSPGETAHAQSLVAVALPAVHPASLPETAIPSPEPPGEPLPAQQAPEPELEKLEIAETSAVPEPDILADAALEADDTVPEHPTHTQPLRTAIVVLPPLDGSDIAVDTLFTHNIEVEVATTGIGHEHPEIEMEVDPATTPETAPPTPVAASGVELPEKLLAEPWSNAETEPPIEEFPDLGVADSLVDAPIAPIVPPPLPDFTIPTGSGQPGNNSTPLAQSPATVKPETAATPAPPPHQPTSQQSTGGTQADERRLRLLAAVDAADLQTTASPLRPISVLAIHKGSNVSRLRSANLRLIPGLEFAPLRHEETARKQVIAPLINQPMPGPELPGRASLVRPPSPAVASPAAASPAVASPITSTTPSQTGAAFTLPAVGVPPLPPLQAPPAQPAAPAPTPRQKRSEEKKKSGERGTLQAALDGKNTTKLPESSLPAMAEMTPLEELAKRLENARIPVVEDEEHHRPVPFEPSIVSDTLANILVAQGAFTEALKAFQTLARTKPERLDYYKIRIAEIKRRLSEQPPLP